MKHRPPIAIIILLFLLVSAAAIYYLATETQIAAAGAALAASGTVETTEIAIAPEVTGKVREVSVKSGDAVSKGDVLFSLDGMLLQAQRSVAQAARDTAQAALESAQSSAGTAIQAASLEVLLAQTDSTSAAGWMRKSNFADSTQPLQLVIARELAMLVMDRGCGLVSQWFPGEQNVLSDSLSRDTDLTDHDLTHLFASSIPEQVPQGFNICPLPPALCSKLETWLRNLPPPTQSPSPPHRSKLRTGATTSPSLGTSNLTATPSSPPSKHGNANASLAPLPPPIATADSAPNTTHHQALLSCLDQCVPPSTQWLRPSGLTTVSAPPTTQSPHASHTFYSDN